MTLHGIGEQRPMLYQVQALRRPEREAAETAMALAREVSASIAGSPPWVGPLCWSNTVEMVRATTSPKAAPPTSRSEAAAAIDDARSESTDPSGVVQAYAEAIAYGFDLSGQPVSALRDLTLQHWHTIVTAADGGERGDGWRSDPVSVLDADTGVVGYDTAPPQEIDGLMTELFRLIAEPPCLPRLVVAALVYFNLLRIHPFPDGNGRVGRCVHTLLAAHSTGLSLPLAGIEEYIGESPDAYDTAMVSIGGPRWEPLRDPRRWLQFSLQAHVTQMEVDLRRVAVASRLWDQLGDEVPPTVTRAGRAELHGAILGRHLRLATVAGDGRISGPDAEPLVAAGWLQEIDARGSTLLTATGPARALADAYHQIDSPRAPRRHFWRAGGP